MLADDFLTPTPVTVTEWIAETTAERAIAERELIKLRGSADTIQRAEIVDILDELGGMVPLLKASDRTQRATFYEAVGLTGLYDPGANLLHLTSNPRGDMVRVGGATRPITPRAADLGDFLLAA